MVDVFCGKCNKICQGEALEARGEYFHVDCFKCKGKYNTLSSICYCIVLPFFV